MRLYEIFYSLQGESLSAGLPTIFVRFVGCNLRCRYCDTKYAYKGGEEISVRHVLLKIQALSHFHNCKRICITGGEPLLQKNMWDLLEQLSLKFFEVTVETNGSVVLPTSRLKNMTYCIDYKLPGSGMEVKMILDNWEKLCSGDVVKFVVSSSKDFEVAHKLLSKVHYYAKSFSPIFSPVFGKVTPKQLAEWILDTKEDYRMQVQLHKIIWSPKKRGV